MSQITGFICDVCRKSLDEGSYGFDYGKLPTKRFAPCRSHVCSKCIKLIKAIRDDDNE